ncbi:MAG: DNA polymerase III subunit alpha [Candidatus Phytoplasma cynodontis]|uniref:helix-hairpin-helix domain-containing protein n=1 Tax='Cynodon dactylon' phytoplasma TaxID=295320 RepID=UPI001265BB80|nr:PHP domain-containing protein ['Cynodon dactylon' phytoplasma]KAB8121840.1 DNA polymerase III subunit alpha ['Cynodon dactylon' phytoplasma]WIA07835.1 MAG: DNA polymerase III subunit alpha [Candidatus Phytoplasma cynodontis]
MLGVFYLQTFYSIMKSIDSVENLIKKAKKNSYDFVALSEDENLYSMIYFLDLCDKYKIKPIIGVKIYLHLDFVFLKEKIGILIYSLNDTGIRNLIQIVNLIKIKKDPNYILLSELVLFQEGNFFILSNIDFVFCNILEGEKIKHILFILKSKIKYFFLGLSLQSDFLEIFSNIFLSLSEQINIKVVPVHKTNYLEEKDKEVYEFLLELSNQKLNKNFNFNFLDKDKIKKKYQVYFDDYKDIFLDLDFFIEKIKYSNNIINFVNKLPFDKSEEPNHFLKKIVYKKLLKKFSEKPDQLQIYSKRLSKELKIIQEVSYAEYFLIVYDLVSYAKKKKILIGPGRGSSSSSLVCFFLGITEVNPLLYDLIFERFLNSNRKQMPDIDLDFPDDKIILILNYIVKKYGIHNVANIITFYTLSIKSLKNEFKKKKLNINIEKIKKLEGIPKNIGTHPAGIIISKYNLYDCLPVQKNNQNNNPFLYQTQFDIKQLTKIGINKIDLLSLKNLSFVEKILIKIPKQHKINWSEISLTDSDTFRTLQQAYTNYIFQLESSNARKILKKVFPKKFEDLVDVLALNRPGPIIFLNDYIKNKKNPPINIIDKSIDFIVSKTNGIILYQEQIMEIAFHFAGYNLGEAELFMKSVTSLKNKNCYDDLIKKKFINSSEKKGHERILCYKIYNYILKFSNYTFNKSHSVAYSLISYRMTYLKTHFFLFFFMVLLDENIKNSIKTFELITEIRSNKKVFFLKPDIFLSTLEYKLVENNKILLPLTTIKNLDVNVCRLIIQEREKKQFQDFYDFKYRCKRILNNIILKDLIFSGSLDSFGFKRKTLFQNANLDFLENEEYFRKKIEQEDEYPLEYLKAEIIKIFGFYLDCFIF